MERAGSFLFTDSPRNLLDDRQVQIERERLIAAHLIQWAEVLFQPLVAPVMVFAIFHPPDQLLPRRRNIIPRLGDFTAQHTNRRESR